MNWIDDARALLGRAAARAGEAAGRASAPVLYAAGAAAGLAVAALAGLFSLVGAETPTAPQIGSPPAAGRLFEPERLAAAAVDAELARPSPGARRPMVAIIIDDLGLSDAAYQRLSRLAGPLTISVLPYGDHARDHAIRAARDGREVFLHAPMEASEADAGPGALRLDASSQRLRSRVRDQLAAVPGASGVNGHMGSAFTADRGAMRVVLDAVTAEGLFFVDSRTTPDTAAAAAAADLGIAILARDVFLDDDPSVDAVRGQIRELEALARSRGYAIGIGHPRTATVEALAPWLATAPARGIEVVTVGELSRRLSLASPAALAAQEGAARLR